jgi:hypothetical protein
MHEFNQFRDSLKRKRIIDRGPAATNGTMPCKPTEASLGGFGDKLLFKLG